MNFSDSVQFTMNLKPVYEFIHFWIQSVQIAYFFNTASLISIPKPGPFGTLTHPFCISIGLTSKSSLNGFGSRSHSQMRKFEIDADI